LWEEGLLYEKLVLSVRSRRADSNRLPLLQVRVIHQALQGVAQARKSRIDKGLYRLQFAARCTVLRSRWYQSGISPLLIGYPLVPHLSNTYWPDTR
jgi:hypothetical protein